MGAEAPNTVIRTNDALRVEYAAIGADARDADRCGIAYPGAAGRCTGDARFMTALSARDARKVPLCRRHAGEYAVGGLPDPFLEAGDG